MTLHRLLVAIAFFFVFATPHQASAQTPFCDPSGTSQVAIQSDASGNNEIIALTAAQTIYICKIFVIAAGTVSIQFITGTGTACATNEANISGDLTLVANVGFALNPDGQMKGALASAFCIENSAAIAVGGWVSYRKIVP